MKRAIAFGLFLLAVGTCNKAFAATYYISKTSGTDNGSCGSAGSPCATFNYAWGARGGTGGDTFVGFDGGQTHDAFSNPPSGTAANHTIVRGDSVNGSWVKVSGGGSGEAIGISGATVRHHIEIMNFYAFNAGESQTVNIQSPDDANPGNQSHSLLIKNIFSSGTVKGLNAGNFELSRIEESTATEIVAAGFGGRNEIQLYGCTNMLLSTFTCRRDYTGTDNNPSHCVSIYDTRHSTIANGVVIDGGPIGINVSDHGGMYQPGNNNNGGGQTAPYTSSDYNTYRKIVIYNYQISGDIGFISEGGTGENNKRTRYFDMVTHLSPYGASMGKQNDNYEFHNISFSSHSTACYYAGNTSGSGGLVDSIFCSSSTTGVQTSPDPTNSNVVGNGTNYSGASAGAGSFSTQVYRPYIVRVETGTANKGAGTGGTDAGANLERFWDPTATVPPKYMWPWPNEDNIRTAMCAIRNSEWCKSGVSLSTYILVNANGARFAYPPEYSGDAGPGCSGTSLNPSLTNITTGSFTASWTAGSGSYILVVDDNSDFSSPVSSGTVTNDSWGVGDLSANTLYYVEVKDALDPDCAYSSTSGMTLALSSGSGSFKVNFRGQIIQKGNLYYK